MADRTPLTDQLEVIERLLVRAKAEKDWPSVAPLKATADLIRWTMANAETLKVAAAVVRDRDAHVRLTIPGICSAGAPPLAEVGVIPAPEPLTP